MSNIKEALVSQIIKSLDVKIDLLKKAIESAKESRDNETKSSVGDKYETGRTLMQMEVEKNRIQLTKNEKLKTELLKIDVNKKHEKVEFGSLVKTSQFNYFISVAIGKENIDNETFFCISLASPVGKLLQNKKAGDIVLFQGKHIEITEIL